MQLNFKKRLLAQRYCSTVKKRKDISHPEVIHMAADHMLGRDVNNMSLVFTIPGSFLVCHKK